ncbi:hypothetical protein [Luminiphilus syltensis]|nr:hypothetical protein [Luminiphilus syltensis]
MSGSAALPPEGVSPKPGSAPASPPASEASAAPVSAAESVVPELSLESATVSLVLPSGDGKSPPAGLSAPLLELEEGALGGLLLGVLWEELLEDELLELDELLLGDDGGVLALGGVGGVGTEG